MNTLSYLIVLSKGKNFKPLQEKFNQLSGFYNAKKGAEYGGIRSSTTITTRFYFSVKY